MLRDAIARRLAECGLQLNRAEDPHRVLQGLRREVALTSTRRLTSWGTRSARDCRGTRLADSSSTSSRRSQRRRAQADAAGDPPLAPAPASGQDHQRPGPDLQPDHPGLDQLLRALLPPTLIQVLSRINAYLVRWAMQVQAAAAPPGQGTQVPGRRLPTPDPTCSLTGDSVRALTAGRWEPGERRRSRRVLREPGGATPPGDSTDVHRRLVQDPVLQVQMRAGERLRGALADRVNRAGRQLHPEQVPGELGDPAPGDTVTGGQRHDRGLQPRPERAANDRVG